MGLESLPMHDGPMSCYTVCAIGLMVAATVVLVPIYVRYNANEFRRADKWVTHKVKKLETAIGAHDIYIDHMNGVINKIHVDLAVQKTSMNELKDDINEIKRDIKLLLKR